MNRPLLIAASFTMNALHGPTMNALHVHMCMHTSMFCGSKSAFASSSFELRAFEWCGASARLISGSNVLGNIQI